MAEKDEGELLTGEDRAFARSMRSRREEIGLTQGQLAERLRSEGFGHLSQVAISRIEQLKRAARLGEARAIARVLGVPLGIMDSPSDPMIAVLRPVLGRPGRAVQELDVLRDAAEAVGATWGEMESDRDLARRIVEGMRAKPELVEDAASAQVLEDYLDEVDSLLTIDPVLQARTSYQKALHDAKAKNAAE